MKVYEFRKQLLHSTDTPPIIAKASREEVERLIQLREFEVLFGGYVLWAPPENPTTEMRGDAIGVWGRRNVTRFRRVLRERGATVVRVLGEGPEQPVRLVKQDYRHARWFLRSQPGDLADDHAARQVDIVEFIEQILRRVRDALQDL